MALARSNIKKATTQVRSSQDYSMGKESCNTIMVINMPASGPPATNKAKESCTSQTKRNMLVNGAITSKMAKES